MKESMNILHHQKAAMDEIIIRARTYYGGQWRGLAIQPRFATLLTGPTGSGKTTVARMAADQAGASMLRVSASGWMPCGAHNRGTKETINLIAEHVAFNDRTFLVIDELDKLVAGVSGSGQANAQSSEGWQSYIRGEIYELCDGRWPPGMIVPYDEDGVGISIEALTTKLRESVFVMAIGTFQSWFDCARSRRTIGFSGNSDGENEELTAECVSEMLPRELANRFNSSLVHIPQLHAEDYYRIAKDAAGKLPLHMRTGFGREVARRIDGAITAKKGVRFLEEAVMEVLKYLSPIPSISAPEIESNHEKSII